MDEHGRRPCPACGHLVVVDRRELRIWWLEHRWHAVMCTAQVKPGVFCMTAGPMRLGEADAVDEWNLLPRGTDAVYHENARLRVALERAQEDRRWLEARL